MAAQPIDNNNDMQPEQSGPQVGQTVALPALPQPERERRQHIGDTWKAYKGDWGAGPLKLTKGETDDNVRPNRCMAIVDTGVTFLFGEVVKIEISSSDTDEADGQENAVDNGAAKGTSQAQAFLNECWGDDDDMMTLLSELAMNGAIAGSAFAMIIPANPKVGQQLPRLTVLDPQNVTVFPDPHDCRTVREYWIQYEVSTYDTRGKPETITYRKVICRNDPDWLASTTGIGYDNDATWLILDFMRRDTAGSTRTLSDTGAWTCTGRTDWPKPWPPIIDCQNLINPNEYWGLADLPPDLVGLNRALIFNESNTARIIKHHAHPTRWAKGVGSAAQIDSTPDNILVFQSQEASLNALSPATDLANAMAFGEILRSDMDEQSQVPGVALGRMATLPRGALSGVTIRALYAPIMAKTTKKRRLYGRLIRDASQRFLELGGFVAASQARIQLHWKDPMPSDDLAAAQTAVVWNGLGVSADTLMQQAGYDPDIEAKKAAQESARSLTAFAQGQGLPPAPPPPVPPNAPQDASQQQPPAQANTPPVNHPAAIAARQKMQTAFGKGG